MKLSMAKKKWALPPINKVIANLEALNLRETKHGHLFSRTSKRAGVKTGLAASHAELEYQIC
jgi:hypothetical protein